VTLHLDETEYQMTDPAIDIVIRALAEQSPLLSHLSPDRNTQLRYPTAAGMAKLRHRNPKKNAARRQKQSRRR